MACGCSANSNPVQSQSDVHAGTFTLVDVTGCPSTSYLLAVRAKIDELLNTNTLAGELTYQDLIDSISPLNHSLNTNSTCGNAEIIRYLGDQLSIEAP